MGSPVVAASPRKSPSSGRRTNKPLVEKKRRARINGCLGQLKSLILSAMQTEGAQVSRLEKADILEMTVKYLRHIQRQQVTAAVTAEPEVVAKFSAGYSECATEVIRYMDSVQCVTPEVRSRLESHLVERLRGSVPVSAPSAQTPPTMAVSAAPTSTQLTTPHPQAQLIAAYSSHVTSTTTTTSADEMTRHYQTALDLANMAAAVTAKETAAVQAQATAADVHNSPGMSADVSPLQKLQSRVYESSNRNLTDGKDSVRSHSISPASMGMRADESLVTMSSAISSSSSLYVYDNSYESRRRHSSSEPTFSTSSTLSSSSSSLPESLKDRDVTGMNHANNDLNNNYVSNIDIHNRTNQATASSISTSTSSSNHQNISDYLNAFQRPLHIHIPDSPPPPTTPSPPFLHPQVSYPHPHPHPQGHVLIAQTAMPFRNPTIEAEEAPATILYACDSYQIPPEHQRTSAESANPLTSRSIPSHAQNSHDNLNSSQVHNNDYRFFSDSNKENNNNSHINAYTQSGKQMTPQVARMHGNVNNVMSDSNNCARVPVHYSHPHPAVHASVPTPATPSPPTLTREEFYHQAQIAERNGLYDHYNSSISNNSTSNYVNYSNDDRMPANTNACRNTLTLGLRSGYGDHLTGAEEHENSYYSHQPNNNRDTEFRHPSHHYDHISSYPHQPSNQSAIVNTTTAATTSSHLPCREHSSAEQDKNTAVYTNTNDHAMNGPSPHPRAPTRQNETSLSPPTLKRRLLFAQGSESKGTALRCKQGHSGHSTTVSDKRQSLQHVGVGQSEIREKRKVWADGGQAQTRLCRDAQVTSPAAELCTAPAHTVSADEGLWRPW